MLLNKIHKIVGANLLAALLAWWFFDYVDYVLNVITPDSFSFDFEALAVICFIVLVSTVSLGVALFRDKKWSLLSAGVIGLIFLAGFGWSYINLVGVGITILLFLYARHNGLEEIDQRTKINSRTIIRRSASLIVMALFILISFAAFQSPVAKEIAAAQKLPSASGQLIRSIVESFIGSQIDAGGQEKENIITQVSNETFTQINNILKPYFQYAPPLLAFGLFLVLWGLSWFLIQLSVLVGMFMFWVLRRINFIKIEEKDVKAEMLVV